MFLTALADEARPRFEDAAALAETLTQLREAALAAYPDLAVDAATFAAELARRLGAAASPEQLARVRADHVHLAIACAAGDPLAVRRFEDEFLGEVDATARRLRARPDQADEVRSHMRRILFVSEPRRPAALREFSGRGDLRSYLRVIATRELVRVINKGRREVGITDDAFLDMLSPASDPQLGYLRERYRPEVDAAMRAALSALSDQPRALLRYSVVDGWTIDRIGALYGIHRATAARRIAAAREELGGAIRAELAARLAISIGEVDSIVRLVQSRIEVSIERLLQ
ncbi:MAG TPA: sigma factor-like helix-turn-helix DNA-binding protein [Kofleriaceae bacterium]|nr:sigma factor-like helix-turn-helix DNA-binding protein [Kofleriaceae bacterium]